MSMPPLLRGLDTNRVAWTIGLAVAVTASISPFFINKFRDLLVSALCVGFTIMLLVTIAGNLRIQGLPREARMALAVVIGSVLGTMITSMVKGRNPLYMWQHDEALWRVLTTTSLGIGFGGVIILVYMYREQKARAEAEAHLAEAGRHRTEKQLVVAQLKTMQAQVEPHFLFNTLATVQHLVDVDPPQASRMLGSLIAYLRAAMPQMRESETTVGREFALARAYLEVLQVRMGPRLSFTTDLPPALASRTMPPMMLISLVEHAIKHGLEPEEQGGRIEISAREVGDRLHVQVSNDGAPLDPRASISRPGGTGLSNIRERLAAMYGDDARLVMEEATPKGVIARLELPRDG